MKADFLQSKHPILARGDLLLVAACTLALFGFVCAGLGATVAKDAIIEQCETHESFTRLGAAGDRTYSCTRTHFYETSL